MKIMGQGKRDFAEIMLKEIEYLNIKPDNILINDKNIKLIDYGIKFLF